MNTYIVIGAPGMGKTPFVKNFIGNDKRCLVWDVQNEYGQRTKYPNQKSFNLDSNTKLPRSRYVGASIEEFTKIVKTKRDTIVVMEEATGFFRGKQNKETAQLLINRYHTGNVYMFLFHSINRVPPEIMEMSNYVILFRTNDETNKVEKKYEKLLPYFFDLKQKSNGEYHVINLLQ